VTSTFEGCRDPPKCRFARESRGRVRSRCTKLFRRWRRPTLARVAVRPVLGRFVDVVAAPVWVQAWVGAVGRVRNASPILGSLPLPKCGVRLCYSLSFDYVVFLVQSKSPAEDADHVAFSDNSLLAHCPRYCREGLRCRIWV